MTTFHQDYFGDRMDDIEAEIDITISQANAFLKKDGTDDNLRDMISFLKIAKTIIGDARGKSTQLKIKP
jgi:hypothetical protein